MYSLQVELIDVALELIDKSLCCFVETKKLSAFAKHAIFSQHYYKTYFVCGIPRGTISITHASLFFLRCDVEVGKNDHTV